jgi:hypothetical protein
MSSNPYRLPFTLDTNLEVTLEKQVVEALRAMHSQTNISQNELVNTALKRFIATHSDYLPRGYHKKPGDVR